MLHSSISLSVSLSHTHLLSLSLSLYMVNLVLPDTGTVANGHRMTFVGR